MAHTHSDILKSKRTKSNLLWTLCDTRGSPGVCINKILIWAKIGWLHYWQSSASFWVELQKSWQKCPNDISCSDDRSYGGTVTTVLNKNVQLTLLFALLWSQPTPEANIWFFSSWIRHFVHQLAAGCTTKTMSRKKLTWKAAKSRGKPKVWNFENVSNLHLYQ